MRLHLRRLVDVFRYIRVVRCSKGNNALDFQLSSYLGYMLFCAMDGDRFLIVSKDKGYTPLESFWGEQDSTYRKNILVRRIDPEEMSRFLDEREAGNAEKTELSEIPTELGVVFVPQTGLKTAGKRQQPAAPPTKAAAPPTKTGKKTKKTAKKTKKAAKKTKKSREDRFRERDQDLCKAEYTERRRDTEAESDIQEHRSEQVGRPA